MVMQRDDKIDVILNQCEDHW